MAYIQDWGMRVQAQPQINTTRRAFLHLSQNENGRMLNIRITDVNIPSGSTAVLAGTKPDGTVYSQAGTLSGNTATFAEDVQMTAVAGTWDAKITVTNGGNCICTARITITIDPDTVAGGAIPSDSQLDGIIAECRAIADSVRKEAYGSPLVADAVEDMTDTGRVYVYTGSESGMTAGHWYYYNGTAWADGGVYNAAAVDTDTTLSIAGKAADAKKVGDELADVKADLTDVKEDIDIIRTPGNVNLINPEEVIKDVFLDETTGQPVSNTSYSATDYIQVDGTYTIRMFDYTTDARIRIYLYDSNKAYVSRDVRKQPDYPRGYSFTWTGYIRINIDNNPPTAYADPYQYMLVKGLNTDNVASVFIPYYTAYDRTARSNYNMISSRSLQYADATGITDANNITDIRYYYLTSKAVENLPYTGAGYLWCIKLNNSNILQLAYDARANSAYMRAKVVNTWESWHPIGKNDLNSLYETSTISLFPSVGCCGDSFTAGYLYNKTDSPYYDPDYVPNGEYPAVGYPAVMGRLYGVDVTAYAKGGLTSTAYRTDSRGLPALLADEAKYLYIIALGLNDKTQNVPLGVEADIDTEPSTPTYLGNMGAIIRSIKTHAPYSRIILCKSLWMNNNYYSYISNGVELLSSHLGIPYIETLGDPYFESSAYKDGLKGLHPTAPLYAGIGKRMGELVGKCIIDHPEYFYNFYVPNET